MYCNKCGNEISEESVFCSKCGNKIEQVNTQAMNETVQSQNAIIDNSIKSNNENINEKPKTTKKTNVIIIIAIIIIGLILGVGFAMFNDNSSNDVSVKIKQSYVTSDKEMRILFFDNGSCIMYESGATQDETFPALYTIDKENKEIILKFDNGSIFGFEY
ncbi:MAG: zinc ribbon domain-containing protein, partial [Clostridia bacterium]|nr:zinc ribbon domain-containing protein [Clostridia bacterium]